MLKLLEMKNIVSGKNIRNEHDDEITELASSIEKQGLINPILVQKRNDGKYEVIAGHRRYEAVKRLGLPHIECNVFEDLSEKDILLTQLAENVQRKNMSAWELVELFEDMKKRFHLNNESIAKLMGKSAPWVSNQYEAIKLLESQYGKNIPKEEKKKSYEMIRTATKKITHDSEIILCKGMKVKITGHTYHIYCGDISVENALREFIEKYKQQTRG